MKSFFILDFMQNTYFPKVRYGFCWFWHKHNLAWWGWRGIGVSAVILICQQRWSFLAFHSRILVSFNFSQFNMAEIMCCHPFSLFTSTYMSFTPNLWFLLPCVSSFHTMRKIPNVIEMQRKKRWKMWCVL